MVVIAVAVEAVEAGGVGNCGKLIAALWHLITDQVLCSCRVNLYNSKTEAEACLSVALARGSREPGQDLSVAAISGVLLCEGLCWAGDPLTSMI